MGRYEGVSIFDSEYNVNIYRRKCISHLAKLVIILDSSTPTGSWKETEAHNPPGYGYLTAASPGAN